MTIDKTQTYLTGLLHELCKLPKETEWVEFKHNNAKPEEIGAYLSALSNTATLLGKTNAYLIWGIDDQTHDIVGTNFKPAAKKIGNEELENWLLHQLNPKINFRFYELEIQSKSVVLLEIGAAFRHPTQFKQQEYIRIGSYKKKLKDYPEKERDLWRIFDQQPFEHGIAAEQVTDTAILSLLDYHAYFDLLEQPLPDGHRAILNALSQDDLIQPCAAGGWNITNLGAMLFAKHLDDFSNLKRKAMRVIQYKNAGRTETIREQSGKKGYASGFENMINLIMALIPSREVIENGLRETTPMFPELAIRELIANALIHQDFFATGTGPMVEVFDHRIEITNPGEPLVDIMRFVDSPPKSKNEALASLMRRFRICEERGSGIDKVIEQIEQFQLPAPLFEKTTGFTRATLFAHRPFNKMDNIERNRVCYLHACLKYVKRDYLTNASLRQRMGIENSSTISRYIRAALDAGLINVVDENAGRNMKKYKPYWA